MTRWVFLLIGMASLAHVAAAEPVTEVHYVMGTYFRITAEHTDAAYARTVLRRCFAATRDAEARFSRFDPDSELSQINAAVGDVPAVSADMAALLQRAIALRAITDGTFDVSIGALTTLWRDATQWPSRAQLNAAGAHGENDLAIDGHTLHRGPNVRIDLDGVAKGWAIDRCVALLRAGGIRRAYLSFGESSLYALGAPEDTSGWTVTLRGLDEHQALGTLIVRDQAVSVSAVFGHQHLIGGRRIGHIIDPRSGLPLTSPALAFVVAPSATDAEAWSKALLVRRSLARTATSAGALLVRPGEVQVNGHLAFTPFATARPITAAMEPLR